MTWKRSNTIVVNWSNCSTACSSFSMSIAIASSSTRARRRRRKKAVSAFRPSHCPRGECGPVKVKDNGLVDVAFADGDLVDRDSSHVSQRRRIEAPLEVALLHCLHRVPGEVEVSRHVEDRHEAAEHHREPLECLGVVALSLRERAFLGQRGHAPEAEEPRDRHAQLHVLRAHRQRLQFTHLRCPCLVNAGRVARRTPELATRPLDYPDQLTALVMERHVAVADHAERVIQYLRRHPLPP